MARIAFVEVISAISRREKGRHLSAIDAKVAIDTFEKDYQGEFRKIEINEILIYKAAALARKHTLRGYDALQLAAALETEHRRISSGLAPITLLSADIDLNDSAVIEGLIVENPNNYP